MNKELEHTILDLVYSNRPKKEIAQEIMQAVDYYSESDNDKVRYFHGMTGQPRPNRVVQISHDCYYSRIKLIREEFDEYKVAWSANDYQGMADALADLKYVVIGTEVAHGFPGQEIFDEVHRSNMTKKDGWLDENGKWQKGPSYEEPNLLPILKKHGYEEKEN